MPVDRSLVAQLRRVDRGPAWLRERRDEATEVLTEAELPSTDEEIWRYSRIDDIDLGSFHVPVAPDGGQGATATNAIALDPLAENLPERSASVVVWNGRVVDVRVDERWASKGLHVGTATDDHRDLLGIALGGPVGVLDGEPELFVALHDASLVEPVVVDVPAGVELDAPVVVVHVTDGAGVMSSPRLVVRAGDDSSVSVVEVQVSGNDRALVVPITEIVAGRAARVGHVTVQELGLATWQIGLQVSRVGAEATFRSTSVGFGGDYARLRTDCRLVGRGATGELDAVYFGEGDQTLDFRTFQEHIAPDCTSNLLFKGAVGGRSRSVYTGLIRVAKTASGTNAFQTNRNIKLSDHAWAESVPNLVIENNDVHCSHASAVGPIDEEQRFYLESRGVPTEVAERLIVGGFFGEVFGKLPVPDLVPVLARTVARKFERREA
jgi:Fe-S cluster assembly protein SufD